MNEIDAFFNEIDLLIENFFLYMQYLNIYFIVSGIVLVLLFVMICVVLRRLSKLKLLINDSRKKNDDIYELLTYVTDLLEDHTRGDKKEEGCNE